jgi:hypothetical protein
MPTIYAKSSSGYKHPLLDFWHRHPYIGFLVVPLFWDIPAKIFQAGVRVAKYGDHRLGSAPATMISSDDAAIHMGMGEGSANAKLSLFGSLSAPATVADKVNARRSYNSPQEGASFPPRGFYRDTQHFNSAKDGAWYGGGMGGDALYNDTRNLQQTASGASVADNPNAYTEAWISLDKQKAPSIYNPLPATNFADNDLVDLVGKGSVFSGLGGIRRLRQ